MSELSELQPNLNRSSTTANKVNSLIDINNLANAGVKRVSYKFTSSVDQAVLLNDTLPTFANFNYSGRVWLRRTSGSLVGSMVYEIVLHSVENLNTGASDFVDLRLLLGTESNAFIRCSLIGDTTYIKVHPRDGDTWETIFDIQIFHGAEYTNIRLEQ